MRILVVDHNAIHPLGRSVYRRLTETEDVTIRVVIPSAWHDNYRTVRGGALRMSDSFDLVPLPVFFSTRTHRLVYRGLGQQVKEFQPDILYINAEPENFQTMQGVWLLRGHPGVKLIFSSWRNIDYTPHGFPYKLPSFHAWIERQVLARAQGGIAFNGPAREIFIRKGFDRIALIAPEVDTSVFTPMRREAPAGSRTFTVGYAGRLHDQKGIDVLFEAVTTISGEVRLLLVGNGPAKQSLIRLALRKGIAGRIEWREPVERVEMPRQLAAMDVLVLPSRSTPVWKEQFGRILIEAMACGVPVIGSSCGEIAEVIGDAGIVFPEDDSASLGRAIALLRDDDRLREEHIRKGRERVDSKYTLSCIVPLYAAFFDEISGVK